MTAGRSTNHESRKKAKLKRIQNKNYNQRFRAYLAHKKQLWFNYWNKNGVHPFAETTLEHDGKGEE